MSRRRDLLDAIANQGDDLPQAVKDCEKSVREDNPDMDKSTAIAICRSQLDMADDGGCPEGEVRVNDRCVPIEEVDIVPPTELSLPSPYHLAKFDPDHIERIEEGEDTVRYTNIKWIGPGRWVDSASRQRVWYSPEGIKNLEVDPNNTVHILHDSENEVSGVGRIDPDSVEKADNGIFADLVFDTSTAAGKFADENMQVTLETRGAKGFGGPSVEIPPDGQRVEFNHKEGMPELKGGKIDAAGLVKNPGSKDVHFARQTAQAAVALSDGQSDKAPYMKRLAMSDEAIGGETLLDALDLEADDLELGDRELADVPVAELVSLIAESYGADPADLMEALDPFINEGGEMQEPEEEEPEEEETPEEEPEEEPEEQEEVDVDVEMVQALDERVQALEDMMDSVMAAEELEEELEDYADAEAVSELEATISELEDAKSDLEERTRELEDAPKDPKTLSGDAANGDGATEPTGRVVEVEPSRR